MPRFLGGGIHYNDILWTVARVRTWDDWGPEWMGAAASHEARAGEAWAAGRRITAVEAWQTASAYYHMAYFIYVRDLSLHARGLRKMVECHDRALPFMEPRVEKVTIAFEDTFLVGLFSRPGNASRPPVVLFIPGLDSTKEGRHRARGGYLRRGLAVLSLDGPGQGETSGWLKIRPDYERAVSAAIDYLESRHDVDTDRIGLSGISLGGYYAARVAAFEPRVKACAVNCGPYDWSECFNQVPQVTREAFQHYSGRRSIEEAFGLSKALTLKDSAYRIMCPLLVAHGKQDPLIPWEQAERLASEASGPTRLVLFEEGNHGLSNIAYKSGPLVADWLAERLVN